MVRFDINKGNYNSLCIFNCRRSHFCVTLVQACRLLSTPTSLQVSIGESVALFHLGPRSILTATSSCFHRDTLKFCALLFTHVSGHPKNDLRDAARRTHSLHCRLTRPSDITHRHQRHQLAPNHHPQLIRLHISTTEAQSLTLPPFQPCRRSRRSGSPPMGPPARLRPLSLRMGFLRSRQLNPLQRRLFFRRGTTAKTRAQR